MHVRPGTIFVAGLMMLGALVVADLAVLGGQGSNVQYYPDAVVGDRYVSAARYQASPGDVLQISPGPPVAPFQSYEILIVESGEGPLLARGTEPPHVYRRAGPYTDRDGAPEPISFKRPEGPPGLDAGWIDIVYVFIFRADDRPPTDPEARPYFLRLASAAAAQAQDTPYVAQGGALAFHRFASWAGVGIAAATLGAGVLWFRDLRRPAPAPRPGEETAALVRLIELGGAHLRQLRAMLFGVAPALLYVAWASLLMVEAASADVTGPSLGWTRVLEWAVLFVMAMLVAAWAVETYVVHRAYAHWRRTSSDRPLGL